MEIKTHWYYPSAVNLIALFFAITAMVLLYWAFEPVVPNAKTIADDIVDVTHTPRRLFKPGETVFIKRTWVVTDNWKEVLSIVRILVDSSNGHELYRIAFPPTPPRPGSTVTRYLDFALPTGTPDGTYYISPRITIHVNPLRVVTYEDTPSPVFKVQR